MIPQESRKMEFPISQKTAIKCQMWKGGLALDTHSHPLRYNAQPWQAGLGFGE